MAEQNPKIVVSEDTKKELDKLGEKNDTYDDIIRRLIKLAKGVNRGSK